MDGLLRLLDELDGDPDEEPSTSSQNGWVDGYEHPIESGDLDYCEPSDTGIAGAGGFQEQITGEPSLGWTHGLDQSHRRWPGRLPDTGQYAWAVEDGEQEHDGREDDERDDERDHDEAAGGLA